MFFGSGQREEVEVSKLNERLDSLFDKKLDKFSGRAARLADDIERTRREFLSACDEFDRLAVEPDVEYVGMRNPNYIKGQKPAYVTALKRILERNSQASGATAYARYSSVLEELQAMIGEVQKTNAMFKMIVHAYPGHLNRFKYASANLESLSSSLGTELGKVGRELEEYNTIKEHLFRMSALFEELRAVEEERTVTLNHGQTPEDREGAIKEIDGKLSEKRAELGKKAESGRELSFKIAALLTPLGKAARIYDHFSASKRKLSDIISSPGLLDQEAGFAELEQALDELMKSVESGRLEIKNPESVIEQIKRAKGSNLGEMFSTLRLLQKEEKVLEDETRHFERVLDDLRNEASAKERRERKVTELGGRITQLQEDLKAERRTVEGLFERYYKKRVTIV